MQFPKKIVLKNKQTLIIRQAEKRDAKAALDYLNKVILESDYLTRGKNDKFNLTIKEEAKIILEHKKARNKIFLVGCVEKQIVSIITFTPQDKERTKHVGEFGITVLKEFWGQGIGSYMLENFIAWAKQTKIIRKIDLLVRADNKKALRLYKKFHFVKEGRMTRNMRIQGKFYDCYAMGLKID